MRRHDQVLPSLLRLRRAHLTVKQIARITGIGATSVTKATVGWREAA